MRRNSDPASNEYEIALFWIEQMREPSERPMDGRQLTVCTKPMCEVKSPQPLIVRQISSFRVGLDAMVNGCSSDQRDSRRIRMNWNCPRRVVKGRRFCLRD